MKRQIVDKCCFLRPGDSRYEGYFQDAINLIENRQLKDRNLWKVFVNQFRDGVDGNGRGWRGEFWGKMMRGGCLIYRYNADEELYEILKESVEDILTTQDVYGRIASYSIDTEFTGWDLWCRKYVLLGLQYFYDICKDEDLKKLMTDTMCRHLDYIMEKVGKEEEGKKPITQASNDWYGLNSSSILEPVVRLYNITGQKKYLDYAGYIIESGGTSIYNIFTHAMENTPEPYLYPVTKAYEMTSCFEGLIEYYRVTGELKWKIAAENYARLLKDSDVTIMGSAGCAHELLNHAASEQCDPDNMGMMQETCVTVTWMKFCAQMLRLTGDPVFADEIEKSAYNDMLGAVNTEGCTINEGLPFDSYAPVMPGVRGRGIGGYMSFREHGEDGGYGCCAAIGSAGLAIIPLTAIMKDNEGIAVNLYLKGQAMVDSPTGCSVTVRVDTEYPAAGTVHVALELKEDEAFKIKFRIPGWSKNNRVKLNGIPVKGIVPGTYLSIDRVWRAEDRIELEFDVRGRVIHAPENGLNPNGKYHVAIKKGPVVMARDVRLGDGPLDQVISPAENDGFIDLKLANNAHFHRNFEFEVPVKEGNPFYVIDGASAGKTWGNDSMMSVWLPTKKYWEVDLKKPVTFWIPGHQTWLAGEFRSIDTDKNGQLIASEKQSKLQQAEELAVVIEPAEGDCCRIKRIITGNYFTSESCSGRDGMEVYEKPFSEDVSQLWKIYPYIKNYYKIVNLGSGKILSGGEKICLWTDIGSEKQIWKIQQSKDQSNK